MNDLAPYSNGETKVPFFKKPGSVTGTILLCLGGIFALINLNPILAFLNSLLANTITFVGLCIALAAIAYCILDPKVRKIVSELYFMLVRKIMGIVVDMDPISIVQHHIVQMKEKIGEITKNMGSLNGLIKESEKRLSLKKAKFDNDMVAYKKCTEKGRIQEAKVYEHSVVRLEGIIKRQEKRLNDAKKWYKILKDLQYAANLTVKDTENEVEERVEEWEMIKKQHKVFTSVMGILQQSDQLNTFTMAMDRMSFDITQKLGEMEDIINETGSIMTKINLDNEITSEKASALLDKYDKYGIEGILSGFNSKALEGKSNSFNSTGLFDPREKEYIPAHNGSSTTANNNVKENDWFN